MFFLSCFARLHIFIRKIWRRGWMYLYRPLFASYGKSFRFDPFGCYTFETISVGDDVNLGIRPTLLAAESKIVIGSHIIFGPEVTILAGDHNTLVVGKFLCDVKVKRPEDDRDVIIEDDAWIGSRAIILKGVTIGRGSIVAAGAVVTKSVPPYTVAAGVPARVVKLRWDVQMILEHERLLYPVERRLAPETLNEIASRTTGGMDHAQIAWGQKG
jgi:acetyltransferase-like isoleucine patch superfamily enzyme